MGSGKESDVHLGQTIEEKDVILKITRLGRTCFRQIKNKRSYYLKNKNINNNWLKLSSISSQREFNFMKLL